MVINRNFFSKGHSRVLHVRHLVLLAMGIVQNQPSTVSRPMDSKQATRI